MNNPSILKRAFRFFFSNDTGLRLILLRKSRRWIRRYIIFLNERRLSKFTKGTKRVIRKINGSKMFLDLTKDDGICRYLIISDIREAYITGTVKKELHEGDIVVDIGANIGYYALLEAKLVGDKGKVYAIEPIPECINLLKENVALNNYSNVEIHQLAIGDKNGVAAMYVGKWLNRSQMKELDIYKEELLGHEISTQVSTIDDFLENKPYPDVIRMDVEGYEYQVIKGMKRTLEKQLPLKLVMEFHFDFLGKEKSLELLRTLKSTGFEIADVTYELDEKSITHSKPLANISSYLTSKAHHFPLKGHLKISIDDILSNTPIRNNEGALDLIFRLRTLETLFKRTIPHSQN